MQEEYYYSPNETVITNLSGISKEQSELFELQVCELSELAREAAEFSIGLYNDGLGVNDILVLLSNIFENKDSSLHQDALSENIMRISHFIKSSSYLELAVFCDLYISKLKDFDVEISETDFLQQENREETFVYHKNAYSDEAYDVLSQEFDLPRVRYASGLREALKLVADGEVTYCILPLEERGARLPTVAEMIYRGDFKINSVTPVFGFDGLTDMRYALVSKGFSVPKLLPDDDRYLEIRIPAYDKDILPLLSAAQSFGSTLYRINSASYDTENGRENIYSIVFCDEKRDFSSLLLFLTVSGTDFTPVGIYKNLE